MSRESLYHDFFYHPEARGEYAGVPWWFSENRFFSYGTVIGMKTLGQDGRMVLLISSNSMSDTTVRHINKLRMACPYLDSHIVNVPFRFGERPRDIEDVLQLFLDALHVYSPDDMRYAHHRRAYLSLWRGLKRFAELCRTVPASVLRPFEELARVAQMENDRKAMLAEIAGLTAKREAARKRREAKERKKRRELLESVNGWSYLHRIHAAFTRRSGLAPDVLEALRMELNPDGGLSFAWIELQDGVVRTSQGVQIEIPIAAAMLKRWRAGAVHPGQHIGPYEIRDITPEHVRIGCHLIPLENIEALAEELLDKQHQASA